MNHENENSIRIFVFVFASANKFSKINQQPSPAELLGVLFLLLKMNFNFHGEKQISNLLNENVLHRTVTHLG